MYEIRTKTTLFYALVLYLSELTLGSTDWNWELGLELKLETGPNFFYLSNEGVMFARRYVYFYFQI
jgi:hypothetical protein